jgi:hypothetical protein
LKFLIGMLHSQLGDAWSFDVTPRKTGPFSLDVAVVRAIQSGDEPVTDDDGNSIAIINQIGYDVFQIARLAPRQPFTRRRIQSVARQLRALGWTSRIKWYGISGPDTFARYTKEEKMYRRKG